MKRWKKVLIAVPVLILVVAGIWAAKMASAFSDDEGGGFVKTIKAFTDPRSLFPAKDRLTVLLLGQDYNHNNKGILYTKGSRADTIMLLSLDLENKKMSAVSIPRDTKVTGPDGLTGKINGTFARGGVDLVKGTLEKEFGIHVDYHVVIKPDAVKEIVDSVGGIDVETIDEMHYDDNWGGLHVHLPAGPQSINGEQAVGFVRFREVNTSIVDENGRKKPIKVVHSKEEGDIRRTARQQQLVRSLMDKAKSLGNVWNADNVVNTAFKNLETTLTRSQALALSTIFKGSTGTAMNSATLPGSDQMLGGAYYWVIDEDRSKAMIDWLLNGDEMAARRLVRISVINGSKVNGVARAVAEYLDSQGYAASSRTASRDERPELTEIVYSKAAFEQQARDLALLLNLTEVRKDAEAPDWAPEVTVRIGPDEAEALKKNVGA